MLGLRGGARQRGFEMCAKMQGIDFYFGNRSHAQKMVDFLQSVIPVRFRQDKQLVSHNIHTSSYNYKFTYSVEIVPICRVHPLSYCIKAPAI